MAHVSSLAEQTSPSKGQSNILFAQFVAILPIIILLLFTISYLKPSQHKLPAPITVEEAYKSEISVQVVVLGDIGRSPRMQYHAISISKLPGTVEFIGYTESALHPDVANNERITIRPLPPPPRILRSGTLPFIIAGPLKALWQAFTLFYTLAYTTKPAKWMLVQNPPSIPTLLLAMLVCFLRKTRLIVDWHNYGWSILASTRGPKHPFVKLSKYYETLLGRWGPTISLTVTNAMKDQLGNKPYNFKRLLPVHDRPAAIFQPITSKQARKKFLGWLPETSKAADAIMEGKTRLLVSSTSWTPDEDFSILLEALCSYSASAKTLPPILAIITGKGPQKEMYLDRIKTLVKSARLRNVTISTAWLTTEDYATLLACADLGVCLHMSSSGVDLPMKVVDMFGAGLPVVGYGDYPSWNELVVEGVNGRSFKSSQGLTLALEDLFGEEGSSELARLRLGAIKEGSRRWDDEWECVKTIFRVWDLKRVELGNALDNAPPDELKRILYRADMGGRSIDSNTTENHPDFTDAAVRNRK